MATAWPQQDNKRYRGKIDRIFVSLTEYYEVDYYVDHYLASRKYAVHDANREVIHRQMNLYPGHAPIKRVDLDAFLDRTVYHKSA